MFKILENVYGFVKLNIYMLMSNMNRKILLLGGTGYLGTILYNKYKSAFSWFIFGKSQYNAEQLSCNKQLIDFIIANKIDIIIDFTRNNKKQLLSFFMLIKKIPTSCIYVHISTYNLVDSTTCIFEKEYLTVKQKIETAIRHNIDYAIRIPWVLSSLTMVDTIDICTNYFYTCTPDIFANQLIDIITNKQPGIYCIDANKYYFK